MSSPTKIIKFKPAIELARMRKYQANKIAGGVERNALAKIIGTQRQPQLPKFYAKPS